MIIESATVAAQREADLLQVGEDALEFLIAGAAAIGIGTELFYDPLVCSKINAGISDYLIANDMPSVADLVGTLSLPSE